MNILQLKNRKYFLVSLFIALLPSVSFAQFLISENNVAEENKSANGGTYSYNSTVKARANNPGKNEVRIQMSIVSYEITDFVFNGEHFRDLYPTEFPLKIEKIRSDVDVSFRFAKAGDPKIFSKTIRGVGSGEFDITHLSSAEIEELKSGYYGITTKEEFYSATFSMHDVSLSNSYFEELDKLKSRRKNELLQQGREQKIAEQNEYIAEQKRKAQEHLKELEIKAEREKKAAELEELNAKVASGHKSSNAGLEQSGYQKAQNYIDQMNAQYNTLQNSINSSIAKFFEENVRKENNVYERAQAGYDIVKQERKKREQQVAPIKSLLTILYDFSFDYSSIKHLNSGSIFIQLIHLSTKSGSTVHDYTTAPQKSYVPSVDDFITDVVPVYDVYSSDIIAIPIHDINAHEFLFNNYIHEILDKSRYIKNGYGVFTRVFFRKEHLNSYINTLYRNYNPTSVLNFIQNNNKFEYESFQTYVSKNLEKEKQYNLRIAQRKLYENGTTTKNYDNGDFYEGDFLSNKRHGKGKMVYNSGHIYEGKWEQDDRNGLGKMTYPSGNIYQGEWVAGSRIGYGKMTFTDGDVYEGQFQDGKFNGQGTYTWTNGQVYTGAWIDDKKSGLGELTFADKRKYIGEFKNGMYSGLGTFTWPNGKVYTGEWKDGKYHGNGKIKHSTGETYEGEWNNGKKNGVGKWTYLADGKIGFYEGEYKDNCHHGTGKEVLTNGEVYEGEWKNGFRNGTGRVTYDNGHIYEGEFALNNRHGHGTYRWPNGQVYSGEWKDGKFHGQGKMTYANGNVYEGEFIDSERNGKGTFAWLNGQIYSGDWKDDNMNGFGAMLYYSGDEYSGDWKDNIREGQGQLKDMDGNTYSGGWKNDEKHGKGSLIKNNEAAEVVYENGELVSKHVFYTSAKFNGTNEFFMWVLIKAEETLPKPVEGEANVDLWFTVDENGKVEVDDYTSTHMNFTEEENEFNYAKELKKIVKSSGVWIPATMREKAVSQKQYLSISILPADIFINYRPIIN